MSASRQAGFNERRCIARDVHELYGCIVVIAEYGCYAIEVDSWQQRLTAALQSCIEAHAALRTVVHASKSASPQLCVLQSTNAAQHLETLPASTVHNRREGLTALLNRAHSRAFEDYEHKPQWNVIAQAVVSSSSVSSFSLAFACSHVMLDGMSGMIFHRDLLHALRHGRIGNTTHQDLPPALDQAVKLPISWSFLLRPLMQEVLPTWLARRMGVSNESKAWLGGSCPQLQPGQNIQTAIEILTIKSTLLNQLLQACRQHKAKLTALLNLLLAQSLSHALLRRGQSYSEFLASTPYDMRRMVPGSASRMANYVSAADQSFVVDSSEPHILSAREWSQVEEATIVLQQRSSTLNDQPVALLSYLSDFHAWVNKKATAPRDGSFSISNLGSFADTMDDDHWKITDMAFSQSADATGAPINVNVASCVGGSLNVVFTWWPGILGMEDEREFIQEVSVGLSSRLNSVVSGPI